MCTRELTIEFGVVRVSGFGVPQEVLQQQLVSVQKREVSMHCLMHTFRRPIT